MVKLVVVIIGQDNEKCLKIALESVKDADYIYYLDGGSKDGSIELANKYVNEVWSNKWDNSKPAMPGIQKNFMLKKLREKGHANDWCLHLDSDEVLDNVTKLKVWIEKYGEILAKRHPTVGIKMRHFINNFKYEDASQIEHFAYSRLFKLVDGIDYPNKEHTLLHYQGELPYLDNICRDVVIWHLAYCGGIWDIKRRYDGQIARKDLNCHQPEYLHQWALAHLFDGYPKREVDSIDIPEVILKEFDIDKDEFYFRNRGVEAKHFIEVCYWTDYFKLRDKNVT